MFDSFCPDKTISGVYDLDFESLYDSGIRGLTFDIDNTLVPDGAPADEKASALFCRLKDIGFKCCLISNNSKDRVETFAKAVGADYLFKMSKPSQKGFAQAMEIMNTSLKDTVHFGDQLFTDVWGANRAGMTVYLVAPLDTSHEPFWIRVKRVLEKFVFFVLRLSKGRLKRDRRI